MGTPVFLGTANVLASNEVELCTAVAELKNGIPEAWGILLSANTQIFSSGAGSVLIYGNKQKGVERYRLWAKNHIDRAELSEEARETWLASNELICERILAEEGDLLAIDLWLLYEANCRLFEDDWEDEALVLGDIMAFLRREQIDQIPVWSDALDARLLAGDIFNEQGQSIRFNGIAITAGYLEINLWQSGFFDLNDLKTNDANNEEDEENQGVHAALEAFKTTFPLQLDRQAADATMAALRLQYAQEGYQFDYMFHHEDDEGQPLPLTREPEAELFYYWLGDENDPAVKYGLMRKDGKIITPCKRRGFEFFYAGYISAGCLSSKELELDPEGNTTHYYDFDGLTYALQQSHGHLYHSLEFDYQSLDWEQAAQGESRDAFFVVSRMDNGAVQKGIINAQGQVILPLRFDNPTVGYHDQSTGYMSLTDSDWHDPGHYNNFIQYDLAGTAAALDRQLKYAYDRVSLFLSDSLKPVFQIDGALTTGHHYYLTGKNNLIGLIDRQGNQIAEPIYRMIHLIEKPYWEKADRWVMMVDKDFNLSVLDMLTKKTYPIQTPQTYHHNLSGSNGSWSITLLPYPYISISVKQPLPYDLLPEQESFRKRHFSHRLQAALYNIETYQFATGFNYDNFSENEDLNAIIGTRYTPNPAYTPKGIREAKTKGGIAYSSLLPLIETKQVALQL